EQREIATEREQEDRVEPDSLEQAKLLWGRGQQFQAGIGAQDASRMRFKGDSHGFRLLRACAAHDVGQNGLVRSVDSVEVTNADPGGAKVGRDVLEFGEDLHAFQEFLITEDTEAAEEIQPVMAMGIGNQGKYMFSSSWTASYLHLITVPVSTGFASVFPSAL